MELKLAFMAASSATLKPFNRTIVELKPDSYVMYLRWRGPFNRTIVELKLLMQPTRQEQAMAFNRTIVELKQMKVQDKGYDVRLLIGPLWN